MLPALQADRTRIADLDAQLLDLERNITTIRAEKTLIEERLDAYRYPVLTLPNEITSEIFLHFLPVYPACPPLNGTLSPTNLTLICRKWRAVALTTPALWRAIQLDDSYIPTKKIDQWLSMSGSCLTSVHIDVQNWQMHVPVELKPLTASASHRARWEYLTLRLNEFSRQHLLELQEPMPFLRHLELTFALYGNPLPGSIVVGQAPLLHSVALNDVAATILTLPWRQLTSLALTFILPSECERILRQTPHLLHCYLSFFSGVAIRWPDLTLLRLESLILNEKPTEYTGTIDVLVPFILPALRTLQVAEGLIGINPCDSLLSFIAKSGCKLEEMCITGREKISQNTYIRSFPSIQLSFDDQDFGDGGSVASDIDSPNEMEEDEDSESGSEEVRSGPCHFMHTLLTYTQ
ncbi:hypothetical protein C8R46DRAFT_180814 [Mycena filopes]|nr:hypothetical protein C8R46DRAFT_180814 [Mycena filopes]